MTYFLQVLFIFTYAVCPAQKLPTAPNKVDASGLRQGKWIIWFSEDWKETRRQDSVAYYREIAYQNDLPAGQVRDHLRSGELQFEGKVLKDRPSLVYDGVVTWYWENGVKRTEVRFENGVFKEMIAAHIRNGSPATQKFSELNEKAIALSDEGKFPEAEAAYLEALEHIEALHGKGNRSYIQIERNLIDNYFSLRNYKEIARYAKELVRLDKRILSPTDSTILEDYDSWGLGATLSGADTSEITKIYEMGVAEGRRRHPSPVFAGLVANLGEQYAKESRYKEAIPLLEEALRLWVTKDWEDLGYQSLVLWLQVCYEDGKYFDKNVALIKDNMPLLLKDPVKNQSAILSATHTLAADQSYLGLQQESIKAYMDYLRMLSEAGKAGTVQAAEAYVALGNQLSGTGQLPAAEKCLLTAVDIFQKNRETTPQQWFSVYSALCDHYLGLGQFDQSLSYTKKCKSLSLDDVSRTQIQMIEISTHSMKGNRQTASKLANEMADRLGKLSGSGFDVQYAFALMTSGRFKLTVIDSLYDWSSGTPQARLKNYDAQLRELEKSYLKSLKIIGADTSYLGIQAQIPAQLFLIEVNTKLDDYRKSDSLLQLVISRALKHLPKASFNQIKTLSFCALQIQKQVVSRDVTDLMNLYRVIFELIHIYREQTLPYLTEKVKAGFLQTNRETLGNYINFVYEFHRQHPELVGTLYDEVLRNKGLVLNSLSRTRQSIQDSKDEKLLALYDRWKQKKNELALASSHSAKEEPSVNVALLEKEAQELESNLAAQSADFQRFKLEEPLTWRKVAASLKPGEAAVEIVRSRVAEYDTIETMYVALVIKPEFSYPKWVRMNIGPGSGDQLEKRQLRGYRKSVDAMLSLESFYLDYWQPLADSLAGAKKVFLSPDGVFHQISISTLQNWKTHQYVLDEADIRLVSSTGDLVTRNSKWNVAKPDWDIELFGNPDFGGDPKKPTEETTRGANWDLQAMPSLPGAEEEVNGLSSLFSAEKIQVHAYIGPAATEAKIKSIINPYVLHIATHGLFLADRKSKGVQADNILEDSPTVADPMLRSGLLFSQCCNKMYKAPSGGNEDGILTAFEASTLTLNKTRLVVLSACETGLGEVSFGEGVYGLQRAFFEAGASSLLMSLWQVDDAATQMLITYFYKEWLSGNVPHDALRKAQLKLRQQYPHPKYWGAFVLVGQ
jgi:CHAT domain-containing protein